MIEHSNTGNTLVFNFVLFDVVFYEFNYKIIYAIIRQKKYLFFF